MKQYTKYFFILIILLINVAAFAQGDESDGGNLEGNDPAPTPINSKLIYLVILGIVFVYFSLKRKKSV